MQSSSDRDRGPVARAERRVAGHGAPRAYRGMGMSPGCVVVIRMAEAGAGAEGVAANRELWTQANSEYTDEHALPRLARRGHHLGHLQRARAAAWCAR